MTIAQVAAPCEVIGKRPNCLWTETMFAITKPMRRSAVRREFSLTFVVVNPSERHRLLTLSGRFERDILRPSFPATEGR